MAFEKNTRPSFPTTLFNGNPKMVPVEKALNGNEFGPAPGKPIPSFDYIKLCYGVKKIDHLRSDFAFTNRDLEIKRYDPYTYDKYSFGPNTNPSVYLDYSRKIYQKSIDDLSKVIPEMRTKIDKKINMVVPDIGGYTDDWLNGKVNFSGKSHGEMLLIYKVLGNYEIARKSSLIRSIPNGWFLASYGGKDAGDKRKTQQYHAALDVFRTVIRKSIKHKSYVSTYDELINEAEDPLDTNSGFDKYTSVMKEGLPVTKIQLVNQYSGMGDKFSSWDNVKEYVASKSTTEFARKYPLAMATTRRSQHGGKYQHLWRKTTYGFSWFDDFYASKIRVAWMIPYIQNVAISPFQMVLKALRKFWIGCYTSGPKKKSLLKYMFDSKSLTLESDFSNFDRGIPPDVMTDLYQIISEELGVKKGGLSFSEMGASMHYNVNIVLPSINGERNHMSCFCAPKIGLPSGAKPTPEEGTLANLFCNILGGIMTRSFSASQLVDRYVGWMNYKDSSSWEEAMDKGYQPVNGITWMASDDILLVNPDEDSLRKQARSFIAGADYLGLQGELSVGDKMLMRRCYLGIDTPVEPRVWQNSLQPEEPASTLLTAMTGLAMRSEGFGLQKTFDPFETKKYMDYADACLVNIQSKSLYFGMESLITQSLYHFFNNSIVRSQFMCDYLVTLNTMLSDKRNDVIKNINDSRLVTLRALAEFEMRKSTYLEKLLKDIHSPASAQILATLVASSPEIQKLIDTIMSKNHKIYEFSCEKLKVDPKCFIPR